MKGKKVLMSLLALGVMMALGACKVTTSSSEDVGSSSSEPTSSEHSHSWESEWDTDETHHWHACEDSSCTEVNSKAEHTGGVATETEKAKCEVCGVSYGSLKTHEHAYTVSKVDAKYLVSAADCDSAAVYKKSCACGEAGTETFTDGEALGHTWGDWMTKTPATCEAKEVEYRICSMPDCDAEETRDGDVALGHNMVEKYDATHHWTECDNEGCQEATEKVAHSGGEATCQAKAVCEVCEQAYGELADHAYGEWETKTPADCENAEVEHRECTTPNCGHEETRTGDAALGHNMTTKFDGTHHWTSCDNEGCQEATEKVAHSGGVATTTEKAVCEGCNQPYGELANHTHTYSEWTTKTPATCTEAEVEHQVCTNPNCGDEKTRTGDPALGHSYTGDYVDNGDGTHSRLCVNGCNTSSETENHTGGTATCQALAKCEHCEAEYGELADHAYGEWETKTPADCENAEVEHRVCTTPNCGHEETRTGDVALGHTGGIATCTAKAVCSRCEEAYGELAEHTFGDWVVVEPTFDADGSRTRTCTCSHTEEEVLPKLIKVEEIEVENATLKVIEGQKVELKVNILTEGADSYRVEWTSNNEKIKVVKEDGKYYAIGMALANNVTSAQATVTVTVTNVLGETDYEAVTSTMEISVVNPVAEYIFDGGKVVNSGSNSNVVADHGGFYTDSTNKVTEFITNNDNIPYETGVYGNASGALKINHNAVNNEKTPGNHLRLTGIDSNNSDFTISVKVRPDGSGHASSETYLFGLSTSDIYDAKWGEGAKSKPGKDCLTPFFSVGFEKTSKGNRQLRINLGQVTKRMPTNSMTDLEWSEIRVIKSGLTLTITQYKKDANGDFTVLLGTVVFDLTEESNVYIDSAFSIGFGANYGTGHPGAYTYYDDIRVYDFAISEEGVETMHKLGAYSSNTPATCTENATEIATCSVCGNTTVREVVDSKLGHDWDYNDVTITVIPGLEDGLAKMSCTRCEEKHDIVLPNSADYIAQYETYEEGTKLRYNLSVDPSSIDEVVAANPDLDATKLAEALATFVEAKAPSALGHEFSALVNGSLVRDTFVVGGSNKAEIKLNLTKGDKVVFYEDENLMVFGEYGVVPNGSEFTVLYTGEHTFYINTSNELYATYPVNNQTYYLKPSSNWLEANARFAVYFFGNGNGWADLVDEDADGVYEVTIDINNYPTFIFVRMNPVSSENSWDYKWTQTADLVALEATGNCWVVDGWDNGSWDTYPFHVHSYVEIAETPATCTANGEKAHYGCESCELKFTKYGEEYTLLNDLNSLVIPMIAHTYNVPNYDATGHWNECSCGAIEKVDDHEYVESYVIKEEKLYFVESCECGHVVESEVSAEEECLVDSKADLLTVIEAGYDVKLTSDVEVETAIVVTKDVTVDLNGKTISLPTDTAGDGVFHVTSGATLTINGEGTVNGVGANDYSMAIWADGGNVIINGGTYTNVGASEKTTNDVEHFDLIYVKNGGTVTINGGTFINETPRWTLNHKNDSQGKITVYGGKFYQFDPSNDQTDDAEDATVISEKCVSIKNGDYYEVKGMIAEFTFENGLANTGIESGISGTLLSNVDGTRYQEVKEYSSNIYTTHTQGSTVYELGTTAIQASHASNGNSFGLKGIDTGTGDFTITVKVYTPYDFIKQSDTKVDGVVTEKAADKFATKNWQWYLFGTAYENSENRPEAPCFDIRMGKDSNSAGWFKTKVKLNGEEKDLYIASGDSAAGYWQARKWIEFRVVKSGTTVTISTDYEAYGTLKGRPYSVTFTLDSADDFMITPEQVLGFGCNYNVSRPGAYTYYDDIRVYNYAVDFSA